MSHSRIYSSPRDIECGISDTRHNDEFENSWKQLHVCSLKGHAAASAFMIKNGRLYVILSSDGFSRKFTVHSLVAAAFLGDRPPEREITHKDGDYTHNEVSNLE